MTTPTKGRFSVLFLLLLVSHSLAAAQDTQQAERERLARDRQATESKFQAAERACDKRFMQTNCVLKAKRERREAMDALQREEVALNDQVRRSKAAEAVGRVEQRRLEATGPERMKRVQDALDADEERRNRVAEKSKPKAGTGRAPREPDPAKQGLQAPKGQSPEVKTVQQQLVEEQKRQERAAANLKAQSDRERDYAERKAALAKRQAQNLAKTPAAPLPEPPESAFPKVGAVGTGVPAWDAKPPASAPGR